MLRPEAADAGREVDQVGVLLGSGPVEPGELVVVAIGVVVATLTARELVAAQEQRHSLGQEQRRDEVPPLARTQLEHGRVVGGTFHTAVPAAVVVGAVAIVLAVRFVVLAVVADEVCKREPVVHRHDVHRGGRAPAAVPVEIARAADARREIGQRAWRRAPEVTNRVAVLAVPLAPAGGEPAEVVGADVPRLGDQLHLREDRILADRLEEGG